MLSHKKKVENLHMDKRGYPTNIGTVRGTVSVATIVVVSAGVNI